MTSNRAENKEQFDAWLEQEHGWAVRIVRAFIAHEGNHPYEVRVGVWRPAEMDALIKRTRLMRYRQAEEKRRNAAKVRGCNESAGD